MSPPAGAPEGLARQAARDKVADASRHGMAFLHLAFALGLAEYIEKPRRWV